ncbi:immunoglobulin domain-containing protein [Actomonas aquatica]|uniref:Immunoglobulin domain-containing protein n=1 Tax=Actomonas aquatica TaxID=2866162 RepID=A0ABZ1CB10_9BACT|nr:immunoglobulin domain-containing protein [Opitutus sp. WL0086]WRQ88774.1 immunoglobulin domain-containing protein [Opitutus sp. WL0086]
MPCPLPLRRLTFLAVCTLAPLGVNADPITELPVDRSLFDTNVEIFTEPFEAHLPGQPHFPRPGANVILRATTLPGDHLQWFRDSDPVAPDVTTRELRLKNVTPADTGVYWARITRDGVSVDTAPVPLNVVTAPSSSLVDPTFVNRSVPPGDMLPYSLLVENNAGEIGYLRFFSNFFSGSWGWLSPGGDYSETVYAWSYGESQVDEVATLLPDGSHLRVANSRLTRIDRQGQSTVIDYQGEIPLEVHQWNLAENGDLLHLAGAHLLCLASDGAVRATLLPETVDWASFTQLTPFRDGSGRLLIQGYDNDARPVARVLEADAVPVAGSSTIHTLEGQPPTRLTNGDWVEVANSTLRRYGPDLTLISESDLGRWSTLSWQPLPDGYLYAFVVGQGILRLDTELNQDMGFSVQLPTDAAPSHGRSFLLSGDRLFVSGQFDIADDLATRLVARLDLTGNASGHAPRPFINSRDSVLGGHVLTLDAFAIGNGPFTYEWLNLDQPNLQFPAEPSITLSPYNATNAGRYVVKVTSAAGTAYSEAFDLRGSNSVPVLRNLSARLPLGPNQPVLSMGIVVAPQLPLELLPQPSQVVVARGIGPTLAEFEVPNPLADPMLQLSTDSSAPTQWTNDDWRPLNGFDILAFNAIGYLPLLPGSADSQLSATLSPGVHHLQVLAKPGDSGITLGEIYALYTTPQNATFTNLSLRARTGDGDDTVIGGFVIDDPAELGRPVRLLIRAIGPGLLDFNVADVATDPVLQIFDHTGALVASNDNWSDDASNTLADTALRVGAFALAVNSTDAAVLLELAPGPYTAQVSVADGQHGQILLELYVVP